MGPRAAGHRRAAGLDDLTVSPEPRSKPVRQGERSREAILDAAAQLMSTHGYAATSISDLARESGLPASSIYWHFSSKAGVLAAVMERGAQRFFDETAAQIPLRVPRDSELDPQQRLRAILGVSFSTVQRHEQFLRLFLLLLLGSEGAHEQDDIVARVREEGRLHMRQTLAVCYANWGPDIAKQIADDLHEFGVVLFDGAFIALQTEGHLRAEVLVDHLVGSLHARATEVTRRLS